MGKETEQKQEIVNQGVHTYSQEEAYVWPEEPVLREQLYGSSCTGAAGVVSGSEAGVDGALGSVQSAWHGGELGT